MPYPYAYYQDNYNGPVHATILKADSFVGKNVVETVSSGDINLEGKSFLLVDTSGSNVEIDSLTGIGAGQLVLIIKKKTANSLTLKNNSAFGTGIKFQSRSGNDIVFNSGRVGSVLFFAVQDQAIIKLYEINNESIFPELQSALNLKANLASPALTGNPTAPTQATSDESTKIATTAFVKNAINDFIKDIQVTGTSIDWSLGTTFYKTISTNASFTFSNLQLGKSVSLFLKNSGGANITVAFPAGVYKNPNLDLVIEPGSANVYTFAYSNGDIYVSGLTKLKNT